MCSRDYICVCRMGCLHLLHCVFLRMHIIHISHDDKGRYRLFHSYSRFNKPYHHSRFFYHRILFSCAFIFFFSGDFGFILCTPPGYYCTLYNATLYMYTHPFYLERIKYFLPLSSWLGMFLFNSVLREESDESEQERKEGKMMVIIITAIIFNAISYPEYSCTCTLIPLQLYCMNLNENFLSGDDAK